MPTELKFGISFIVILIISAILMPFTIVGAGERTVITRLGQVDRVLEPGMHWVTPLTESTHTFDVQTQKITVDSSAASKDLQDVSTTIALNFNVDPKGVAALYAEIGSDYDSRVIQPALQEAIKSATAKYTAEELITKRAMVKDEILASVKTRLMPSYIVVSDVSITNFKFSDSFNQSIEAKVKAEQDALTAKNKLEQVKFEAEQTVASARAESESIKMKSEAANNEKYVSLMKIEVQKAMAEKWNGVLPVNMYAGAPLPLLNVTN